MLIGVTPGNAPYFFDAAAPGREACPFSDLPQPSKPWPNARQSALPPSSLDRARLLGM